MVRHRFICPNLNSAGRVLAQFNMSKDLIVVDVADGFGEPGEPSGWRSCVVFYFHHEDKHKHIW